MGSIKDRNGMDLTEAEILRRGGKKTQKWVAIPNSIEKINRDKSSKSIQALYAKSYKTLLR